MDSVAAGSRETIRRGSKSFAGAARLLPPGVRESVYHLYAWCRHCDDCIDEQELGHAAPGTAVSTPEMRLRTLETQTRATLDGRPPDEPVFVALSRVVERHRIPPEHPLDLLRGFAMDVEGRHYETLEDVLEYCYHVAGVVGVMMAIVMGTRGADALDRASDLGLALQLTNIARDVLDDAAAGRIYLPGSWLAGAGVDPAEIAAPENRRAVHGVTSRLLAEAERYYRSADAGLACLDPRCAWAIATARGVYSDIGRLVRDRGERAWDQRAVVSRGRKLRRVVGGAVAAARATTVGRLINRPPRRELWTRPARAGSEPA